MDMGTGEIGLQNPDSDTEWETFKSTSTEKAAYFCASKNEWNGPREVTKRVEPLEEEDGKETTIDASRSGDSKCMIAEEGGYNSKYQEPNGG